MEFDPLIVPTVILAATSFILQHFFEDSDRHRVICLKLRAKYMLNYKGPLLYANKAGKDQDEVTVNIIKDYLRYRLVRAHYGIINAIIFLGFSFLIALIIFLITMCHEKGATSANGGVYKCIVLFLGALIFICLVLQYSFARQNCVTAWLLHRLSKDPIENYGSFEKQCEDILDHCCPVKN
jgi:hypothetical protein